MDPKISNLHSIKLDEKYNNLDINDFNHTDIYTKLKQIIASTASEIIGKYRSK